MTFGIEVKKEAALSLKNAGERRMDSQRIEYQCFTDGGQLCRSDASCDCAEHIQR